MHLFAVITLASCAAANPPTSPLEVGKSFQIYRLEFDASYTVFFPKDRKVAIRNTLPTVDDIFTVNNNENIVVGADPNGSTCISAGQYFTGVKNGVYQA